jgi:hypothetical protein
VPAVVNDDDIKRLIRSIESSLADIAEAKGLGAVVGALADVCEQLEQREGNELGPLIEAIKGLKPSVTVNVPAPPPAQIHVMPAQPGKWEIRRPGAYGHADTVIGVIERVA